MAKAAMEWLGMCVDQGFFNVVVSLKSSNTIVMVDAYRRLAKAMQEEGHVFPMHLGVTEAGNGDSGRMKSCVGISTLLSEGIGEGYIDLYVHDRSALDRMIRKLNSIDGIQNVVRSVL